FDGTASIVQPLIEPLYQGRTAHELIGVLAAGEKIDGHEIVRNYWRTNAPESVGETDFEDWWQTALHDGVIGGSAFPPRELRVQDAWQDRIGPVASSDATGRLDPKNLEIDFYEDP